MPTIKKLSTGLINKIAAGEVIERPASVVKELVENSIDAGAKKIEIVIEKAGNELIRVTDNGCGVPSDELSLALSPHATSKIAETDDLFHVKTFGFRGEALASIAEVSQMIFRSGAAAGEGGAEIRSDGGTIVGPNPCGTGLGTSIEVRNLFFNTPVRRKFLKGISTEFGHISEAVVRLAIPNIEIHFILRHNGRVIHDLPPCGKIGERIGRIFGPDFAAKLIPVDSRADGVRIRGYVGHPDISRSHYGCQYFFLNRRFIRDKSLQHALTQAYRGLLTVGRYPVAFLEIEMEPDQVDVNVHPTKMEVRFLEANRVYSALLSGIRSEFLRGDMKSRPAADSFPSETVGTADRFIPPETPQNGLDARRTEAVRSDILGWTKRRSDGPEPKKEIGGPEFGGEGEFADETLKPTPRASFRSASTVSAESFRRVGTQIPPYKPFPDESNRPFFERSAAGDSSKDINIIEGENGPFDPPFPESSSGGSAMGGFGLGRTAKTPDGRPVIQVQNRYLIFETDDGMALVDQHALHERILYEKLKRKIRETGRLESQRLLVPETIDLTPSEAACALENQKTFGDFGLLIESFGGNTILISGYPPLLEGVAPSEIFTDLLGFLTKKGREGVEMEDLLDAMIRQSACKAAVKGGDRLRDDAVTELLALAQREIHSHHCPHGRPSILVLSVAELDKMFKRT